MSSSVLPVQKVCYGNGWNEVNTQLRQAYESFSVLWKGVDLTLQTLGTLSGTMLLAANNR